MALSVQEQAHEIEREITVKAGIPGYPDRIFILAIRGDRIEVREKGTNKYRNVKYDSFIRWVFVHCQQIER